MIARALRALALIAVVTTAAAAEPRVAVVGDDDRAVAAVRAALDPTVELVAVDPPGATAGAAAIVLAEDHQLAAVVVVTAAARKGRREVTAIAYQGQDGAEVARAVVRARASKLAAELARVAWPRLGPGITSARPQAAPSAPTTTVAATATTTTTATATTTATTPRTDAAPPTPPRAAPRRAAELPRLRVAIDQRPFWRRLRFNDDFRLVTRAYDLVADAIGGELAVRPVAALPRLEVTATAQLAIAVKGSRTRDGTAYATSASEWAAGLGYALTTGATRVTARAGYGEQRLHVDDDPAPGPELVPDVTYRYARLALEGERRVAPRWRVTAAAGGRYLLDTGDLAGADFFPRITGYGVDGALGGAYQRGRFTLFARAEVRHYFFAMNPEVGDAMIVGGAVDTFLTTTLGVAMVVP